MKTYAFIPIKTFSERIQNKNFRIYNGKKLYEHILLATKKANCFDKIYVDTDSLEICEFAVSHGMDTILRKALLAQNDANGNDLLNYHASLHNCDYYFQLFATAPNLKAESIKVCVEKLQESSKHDSIFTVKRDKGWYWYNGLPVNYRPSVLPRSQDTEGILKETTGLYGIKKEALLKYKCRIGATPYMHELFGEETKDIDWPEDLK